MTENYLHWRNLADTSHLRAEMLAPNEKLVLTIKSVVSEEVIDNNGQKSNKPVAYFEENVLPMVLNVTNCKTIETIYNTGNVNEWVGKKIQIFATKTRVAKETVPCLRVDKVVPAGTTAEYYCEVCGAKITKEIYEASIAKYGKAYCSKACLDKDVNGENLL